jgi:hypothetical protein
MDAVVFDVMDDGFAPNARRIDVEHLLMQFASRLDYSSVERVILAREGKQVFYVNGAQMEQLSGSYAGGGVIWAFSNLPAAAHRMSGEAAFSEWTGGWLGVMKQQTEDNNELIRQWTGQ